MIREKITQASHGAAGRTKWRNVANEDAWSSMSIEGVMGGATLKFITTAKDPYPNNKGFAVNVHSPSDKNDLQTLPVGNVYTVALDGSGDPVTEITAIGLYPFPRLVGGLWGCIEYSGVSGTTNLDIAVTAQMV